MPSYATHPGKVTFADSDVPKKGTLFAVANVDGMLSLDDRITDKVVTCEVGPDGTLQGSGLRVPILSGLLWTLVFKPNDKAMGDKVLGTYNLNTSLVPIHTLVPTVVNSVTTSVYADIQAAIALGATNDTATASFVNNGASSTTAALAAKYVGKNTIGHRITDGPYLAAGDGTTSDHAALAAAGAAAAVSGLPVILPYVAPGYAFSSAVNLVSGVTYILENGVTVKRTGTTTATLWNAAATTGVTIRGGNFYGNGLVSGQVIHPGVRTSLRDVVLTDTLQQQSAYAIGATTTAATSDVFVSGCRFTNLRNNVHIQGVASRWTVKDNDISGYGNTGIAVDGDSTNYSTDIIIEGNRLHDHDSTTFAVTNKAITGTTTATLTTGVTHSYVVGQSIYVDIGDAIYDGNHTLTAVTGTTLSWTRTATTNASTASTGYVSSGNRQPISIQGDASDAGMHKRIRITGNQIIGNYSNHQSTTLGGTADQISVHHTQDFVVSGNICEGSGDVGITISLRAHRGIISDNVVTGAGNIGIAIGSATAVYLRDLKITDNTVMNSGQNAGVGYACSGINIRKLTGGIVEGNYCGDDAGPVGVGTVTFTDAGDLVTTPAAHGLMVGQRVTFSSITTTTGISAATTYYVLTTPSPTTLTLSATQNGSTLALTTDGSGAGFATVPTQQYGISVGDNTGSSDQVHFGPNHGRGNVLAKRITLAGNTNLTFTDIPTTVSKPSDTASALNSTTLVSDPNLAFACEANAVYEFEANLGYTTNAVAGATPGIKVGFAALTGASAVFYPESGGSTSTGAASTSGTNSNRSFFTSLGSTCLSGGVTGAVPARMSIRGRFTTGTTAGALQVQVAQQTADAVNTTTVVTGSWLRAVRVA